MTYRGDYRVGTTFNHHFTTVNASGVPTTLGNTPSLEYYVDGGTTGFTSGLTLSTDINSRTGLNNVQVVATTSATGLASGKNVSISIAAGTVSGVSVIGYNILEYSLANRSALMPTTGGVTLSVASTGGAAIDWANVGNPGSTVSLSATTLFTTTNLTNGVNANISSSSINLGAIVTACNTIVPANVTAASINIGAIVTACNTLVPANVTAASINIGAVITASSINIGAIVTACNTVVPANVTSISTVVPANVTSFSPSGIANLYTVSPGITYATATATSLVRAFLSGVWDETGANHTLAGSLGQELNSAGAAADPWATAIPGTYTASQAGFIVGTNLDTNTGSRLASSAYTSPATPFTTAMVESYRANGTVATPVQAFYEILSHLGEGSISGTTKTINGVDHVTSKETFTLTVNASGSPTAVTRTT